MENNIRKHLAKQFNLTADQIDAMLPAFITTLHSHLVTLEKSIEENDLKRIGKAAHTIKGALLNLGLEQSAEIAYRIEKSGKALDDTMDYSQTVNTLRTRLGSLLKNSA
ncbi:Hpt domain-containing protein [Desulfomarina sp.]